MGSSEFVEGSGRWGAGPEQSIVYDGGIDGGAAHWQRGPGARLRAKDRQATRASSVRAHHSLAL